MIIARFTSFTENFVICSCQVTKMFRSGHDCTSTSSARSPRYFWSSSRCHNWGPSESACRHSAYPNPVPLLLATPLVIHEKSLGNVWAPLHASLPEALLKYFHQPQFSLRIPVAIPANLATVRLRNSSSSFILIYVFGFCWSTRSVFSVAPHSYFHFFLVLDFRCICLYQIQNPVMKMMRKSVWAL